VLLLDNPIGLSSNAALQLVKRMYRAEKAGHTGTLDPLACGLLPLCFGEATKFAHALLDADKTYVATFRLGSTTSTGDAEGKVIERHRVDISESELLGALRRFIGCIDQLPPMHAALKYRGRNYYEYARQGVEIPRTPRAVVIHALTLDAWNPPDASVRVRCGKGTYVRVLAEDLGRALGCGAHLGALRRTASGAFDVATAIDLDALAALTDAERDARLLPVDALLASLPRLELDSVEAARFVQGRSVDRGGLADGSYCVYADGRFTGLARAAACIARPQRLVTQGGATIESLES